MKKITTVIFLFFMGIGSSEAIEPVWLTAACYELKLSAWDKFGTKDYKVTYIVKSDTGSEFIAEFNANGHNSSAVVFPKDFTDKNSSKKASLSCHGTTEYIWEIYVEDKLKESGNVSFSRRR